MQEYKPVIDSIRLHAATSNQAKLFGVSLKELYNEEEGKFPKVLEDILSYLEAHAESTEGIFRVSGGKHTVDSLKDAINSGATPDVSETLDPHTIPALFKAFLRELPDPLIPYSHLAGFMDLVTIEELQERMTKTDKMIQNLPPAHQYLMVRVLALGNKISEAKSVTKMDTNNIAVVLGPNIIRSPPVGAESLSAFGNSNSVVKLLLETFPFIVDGKKPFAEHRETSKAVPTESKTISQLKQEISLVVGDIVATHLGQIQSKLDTVTTIPEGVPVIHVLKNLSSDIDKLKQHMPMLPPFEKPPMPPSAEKLDKLKFTLEFAIKDLQRVLISVSSCIEVNSDKQFCVTLLQLVKSLNEKIMQSIPKL